MLMSIDVIGDRFRFQTAPKESGQSEPGLCEVAGGFDGGAGTLDDVASGEFLVVGNDLFGKLQEIFLSEENPVFSEQIEGMKTVVMAFGPEVVIMVIAGAVIAPEAEIVVR